jgi:hypothetical protein
LSLPDSNNIRGQAGLGNLADRLRQGIQNQGTQNSGALRSQSGPGGASAIRQSVQSRLNDLRSGVDGRSRSSLNLRDLDRGSVSRAAQGADGERGTGSLRLPLAGRISPDDLGRFLGTRGRQLDSGLASANRGVDGVRGLRGELNGVRGEAVGGLRGRLNDVNLSAGQINNIRTNVNTAIRNEVNVNRVTNIGAINNINRFDNRYFHAHPHRANFWNNWCGGINKFCNFNSFHGCFNNRFWATNFCHFPWRRSYYWWGARPWSYWWGCPTWSSFVGWFPGFGLSSPYYYDYGVGGNVVYDGGYVYVNGSQVATAADYAASAAELATVPTPVNPEAATEWLPLGTFALSTSEADKDPSRVVQLAVDKEGNISGTMFNKTTNQTYPVQGRVDKETQRVAFTIGGRQEVVLETGLYNLTQQQTPVLAHGDGREETYLLYRLEAKDAPATTPAPPVPLLP